MSQSRKCAWCAVLCDFAGLMTISDPLDEQEQSNVQLSAFPYLAGTIVLLGGFAIATLFKLPPSQSQHWEGIFGMVSPGMAMITTAGLLLALGYPYANCLTAVPFLGAHLHITTHACDTFLLSCAAGREMFMAFKSLQSVLMMLS